jgi:hypothetical protein
VTGNTFTVPPRYRPLRKNDAVSQTSAACASPATRRIWSKLRTTWKNCAVSRKEQQWAPVTISSSSRRTLFAHGDPQTSSEVRLVAILDNPSCRRELAVGQGACSLLRTRGHRKALLQARGRVSASCSAMPLSMPEKCHGHRRTQWQTVKICGILGKAGAALSRPQKAKKAPFREPSS